MTAKSLPPATVALIDPESGTSSGGGSSDIRLAVGDVILFRFKYFTSPDGALHGIAGYLTEYVPPNTSVVGVRIIDQNGVTVVPHYPGLTYNGTGGGATSFTVDCGGGTCTIPGGSLAQLYGDTGVFWTSHTDFTKSPVGAFLDLYHGILMDPEPENANEVLNLLGVPGYNSAPSYAHNLWDARQLQAFGVTGAPGNEGNTPYGYGSPVAGSGAYYAYDATSGSPGLEFASHVGPWSRVVYPGSTLGAGPVITADGELERSHALTSTGDYVTPAFPRAASAVRFALGELRAGEPGYVEVALRVNALPLDPGFGANGNVDCGEVFGGNVAATIGGAGSRGTRNAWPTFVPAPACVYLNLLFDVDVDKYNITSTEYVTYSLRAKNLSLSQDTNVCVRFRWTEGNTIGTPTGGSTTPPAGCPVCPSGSDCMYWKPGTMLPSQEWPSTGNVMNMLFDPSGGGHMAAVMYADYFSDRIPAGFTTQAMTIISEIGLVTPSLASAGHVAAGSNATLVGTIQNTGAGTGAFNQLVLWFPAAGWTIVNGGSTLTGCHQLTPPAGYTWNRWECDFVDNSFAADETQNLNLTVGVPAGTATGLYPIDLQIWAFDTGNGGTYETLFPAAVIQAVGQPRTDPPVVGTPAVPPVVGDTCQIVSTTNGVAGTSEANATIKLFINGVFYPGATTTADASGNWYIPASAYAATFGELYGGAEIRATATAPGELESPLSTTACFPRPTKKCSDGIDNDGDGKIDFPADPGCLSPIDNDETDVAECADGIDNDGNLLSDYPADAIGCSSAADPVEQTTPASAPQCADGIDNDGDGLIDYPADPGCHSANDTSETNLPASTDDNVPARLLLVFDTSGSMNWNTCSGNTNTFTGGDGSNECPGADVACATCAGTTCGNVTPDDSRLFKVKKGVSDAVAAFGEVEWGLMRYHQRATAFACPSDNASLGAGGWQGGGAEPCGGGFNAGDVIVSFASDNAYDLVQWMDGRSNWSGGGHAPRGYDFELRGTGTTPIAGALGTALTYLGDTKGADPKQACRPYRVILVSDGKESCGGDPVAAAAALRAAGFITYVIGFATPDLDAIANLNAIAAAGRTGGTAIFVDNEAMLSVELARIVSETVLREICDGVDNNCNSLIDETWPDKVAAKACSVGVGACKKDGFWICVPPSTDPTRSSICCGTGDANGGGACLDPNSGSSAETCNGIDDDCDGMVDDGILCGIEVCNGFDDDGDTLIDEHHCGDWMTCPLPGEYVDCGVDVGECVPGKTKCVGGRMDCDFTAPGQHIPVEETCDCLDNNCNGTVDEGISRECYTGTGGCALSAGEYTCQGVCRPGIQLCATTPGPTCTPNVWSNLSCAGQTVPSPEACNGLDDNCNGFIDDGIPDRQYYTGPLATMDVGACRHGMETCSSGSWSVSLAQVLPQPEQCDGIDNDCNGLTDDGLTRPCYTGGAECDTTTGVCVGACRVGVQTCRGANDWGACVGEVKPGAEVCDGVDNDCDGSVDEDLSRTYYTGPTGTAGTGVCHVGTEVCVAGAWSRDPLTTGVIVEVKPTPEICDGADNDCDGTIDEGLTRTFYNGPTGTRNVGACRDGIETCVNGSWPVTTPEVVPTAEVCNGIDDDCDGSVDESLSRPYYTGPTGTVNVGVCLAGTEVCVSGLWSRDTATPGVVPEIRPSPEICDDKDNDCDGAKDENLTQTLYSGPPSTRNVGECRDELQTCVNGGWQTTTPQVLPTTEVCNGLDDNCSGVIDEDLTRQYYNGPDGTVGVGECKYGVETCQVGSWNVTTAAVLPTPEQCNGLDDDCDGTADDGLAGVPCYPDATDGCNATLGLCVGTCSLGTRSCVSAAWSACVGAVIPRDEECNGLDDNCNGQVDEGLVRDYYTGPNGTAGVGVCLVGEETCDLGTWEVTTPQVVPSAELCDLLDNDCNHLVDDGLDHAICYDGTSGCNLQTGLCIGACTFGTKACVNGGWGACTDQIVPTDEVCNGLDDNCNGQIDEGLARDYYTGPDDTDGVGPCLHGVETCSDGQWYVTTPQVVPAPEECNLVDDDCNGFVDDELTGNRCYEGGAECDVLTASCIGQCRVGVRPCQSGSWGSCEGQQLPVLETCNCLDDNCDGTVDNPPAGEQLPGVGEDCVTPGGCNGTTVCDPARCAIVCRATSGGLTELCNGLDDDCDGQVDEPPATNEPPLCDVNGKCAGDNTTCLPSLPQQGWDYVCAAGHYACIEGSIQCVDYVLPEKEICDGIDNDCDGDIDDGDLCDPGSVCYNGECVPGCKNDEFPCPAGRVCMAGPDLEARQSCANPGVDDCYCVASICVEVFCEAGEICKEADGLCHSLCENVTCGANQECRFGQCVDCNVIGCPAGQLCAGGVCVANPCDGVECPTGQYCAEGECVSSCQDITCPTGQVCRGGECVTDVCATKTCPFGRFCNPETGDCEESPCTGVSCAVGSVCSTKTGQCGTDPCLLTTCGECQQCKADTYNMVAVCEWQAECKTTRITAQGGCAVAPTDDGALAWPIGLLLGVLGLVALRRGGRGRRRLHHLFMIVVLGLASLSLAACELRWYELRNWDASGPQYDASTPPDGDVEKRDASQKDGQGDADATVCIPLPETCNGRDDDCNGVVDDVNPDDLVNDPNNCGQCGRSCDLPHTTGTCVSGACAFTCFPGWIDTNADLGQGLGASNGCECFQTNGGAEVCDGLDNDCDGVVDNGTMPEVGDTCYPVYGCPGGECKGECKGGLKQCVDGNIVCDGAVGPSAETCDGKDNDCNGALDDGVASVQPCYAASTGCDLATGTCTGTCKLGRQTCMGADGWGACEGAQVPQPETCNGLDDDCDGEIDNPPSGEKLPGVDDACYPVQGCDGGVCKGTCHAGAQQCLSGRLACVGAQGPVPETCDGYDNDCNGILDDGLPAKPCYTKGTGCDVVAGSCNGICKLGRISCLGADGWSACVGDVGPGSEVCDGIDNDCDGEVDEGTLPEVGDGCYTFGSGCNVSTGVCTGECQLGHKACQGGAIVCLDPRGPGPETCDAKDNDCNGTADDGLPPRACYTLGDGCDTSTGICKGICKMGRQTCNGTPAWGPCEDQKGPDAESCNGIDDNCDGTVDNPPSGQTYLPGEDADCYPAQGCDTTTGICRGECRKGKTRCQNGQMVCIGAVGPTAEVCDGLDNNCDGTVDEGLVPRLCYPYASGCSLTTGTCVGPCRLGRQACDGGGGWGACTGAIGPEAEICDNLDNNCDGQVDNPPSGQQLPGVGADCLPAQGCDPSTGVCLGECRKGLQACQTGTLVCVGAVGPTAEVCDGRDNDCNGTADDGLLPRACYTGATGCNLTTGDCKGACQLGTRSCLGASGWDTVCQGQVTPKAETCNGIDDNCNDLVDDGTLPGVGADCFPAQGCNPSTGVCVGECRKGAQACASGTLVCNGAVGPTQESCDNKDNDCNGTVDDGIPSQACYEYATGCTLATSVCKGVCRIGSTSCGLGGVWSACIGQVGPTGEICDGKDNNCDGFIDNGTLPEVGDTCYGAASGCTYSSSTGWTCAGLCHTGAKQCVTGALACVGYQGPVAELCDTLDNDCNGTPDNGFDKQADIKNCGTCGNDCTNLTQHPDMANAVPRCEAGVCQRTCKPGFWDVNNDYDGSGAVDGCEYACVYTGIEVCDGVDNDCNGLADNADTGMIQPAPFCRQLGACAGSTHHCQSYSPNPLGEAGDDLNQLSAWTIAGANDVNTDAGVLYVAITYASPTRTVSLYRTVAMAAGDLMAQGSRTSDGVITLAEANGSGLSGSVTITGSTPDSTITYSVAITTWVCDYDPTKVDVVGLNEIASQETRCDNVDNNCDGQADEIFFLAHAKGSACSQDGSWGTAVYGNCRGYGRWVCEGCTDPTDPASCTGAGDTAVCDMACGAPTCKLETSPVPETCDGTDEDCNSLVDDGAPDAVNHVVASGLDYYIYTYEASRPDAALASVGALEHRSCSRATVLPWSSLSQTEAAAACAGAGKRLCTEQEWQQACTGPSGFVYPYGNTYVADACNGWDYDPNCSGYNENGALPTATPFGCPARSSSMCVSGHGAYDMSGNLREWTATQVVTTPPAFRIRGGGYDNISPALTCGFSFLSADATYYHPDLGFRCCTRCAPGSYSCPNSTVCTSDAECGTGFCDSPVDGAGLRHCASCVDVKTSATNCGGCGITCGGGTTCQNGVCR